MCNNCDYKIQATGYGEYPVICPHCGEYIGDDLPQTNKEIVEKCKICKCELYEGDRCFYLDGNYYCIDCVNCADVKLDTTEDIKCKEKS